MKKRIFARALALFMALSLLSTTALAASFDDLQAAIDGGSGGTQITGTDRYGYGEMNSETGRYGVEAWDDNGTRNVQLNENVTGNKGENVTISGADKDITLDLNGYNVEGSYGSFWTDGMIEVKNGADLTVKNTTGDEGSGNDGIIANRADNGNTVLVEGSMTLESGTIAAEEGTLKSILVNNGEFTMNGGKIDGGTQAGLGVMSNKGNATVNGGEISGHVGATAQQDGTLTVTNGTISGTVGSGVSSTQSGKLILNGGTVRAKAGSRDADISIVHGANTVTISEGVNFETLGISSNSSDKGESNTIVVAGKYQITYGKDRTVIITSLDGSEVPPVLYDIAKQVAVSNGDENSMDGNYWEWIILGPKAVSDPFHQIPDPEPPVDPDTETPDPEIPVDPGTETPDPETPVTPGTETPDPETPVTPDTETPDPEVPSTPVEGLVFDVPVGGTADSTTTIEDEEIPLANLLTLADLLEALREHEEIPEIDLPEDFKWIDHELAQAIYWGLQEELVVDTEDDLLDPDEVLTVGLMREVLTNYVEIYVGLDDFVVELEGEDEDLVMDYIDLYSRLAVFYEELEAALEEEAA